jgi:hypothetical protein
LAERIFIRASFVEFCRNLGVTLEPGQEVVARVAIDGEPVTTQAGFDIFGFWGQPPPDVRNIFVAVCGVRSGKSRLFGALHALYLACTVDMQGLDLAPGEQVWCAFVAPAEDTARLTYNYVKGQVEAHAWLRKRVIGVIGADSFLFRSKSGHPIRFCVVAASAGGKTLRGPWHLGTYLEEVAFFQGNDKVVNDEEIFTAVSERILKGGRLVLGSSPWAKEGLLWDLFKTNHPAGDVEGKPTTCLVAHAPTWAMRASRHVLDLMAARRVVREKAGELDLWWREWGAKFLSLGSSVLFDEETLSLCHVVSEADCRPEAMIAGDMMVASCDLALVNDRAALVIGRLRVQEVERLDENGKPFVAYVRRADIVYVKEKVRDGAPFVPSVLCNEFARDMRAYGVEVAMADIHYRETLREAVQGLGIALADAPLESAAPYVESKTRMREGLVGLPQGQMGDLIKAQLRKVKQKRVAGGRVRIVLPRTKPGTEGEGGGHCDTAAAAVLTLFQSVGAPVPPAPLTIDQQGQRAIDEHNERLAERIQGRRLSRRF